MTSVSNSDRLSSDPVAGFRDQQNPTPPTPLSNPPSLDQPNQLRSRGQSHSIRLTATIRTQPISQSQQHPTNNNNGEFPQQTQNLFQMRDRLFLALFFRASLIYARAVPKVVRRIVEFLLLMQSLILLLTLAYIHIVYTQTPITCLKEYKNSWPRDGILRVDITSELSTEYTLAKSYEKEERLRQRNAQAQMMGQYSNEDLLTMMVTADSLILDKAVSSAGAFLSSFTSDSSAPEDAEASLQPDKTTAPDTEIFGSTNPPDDSSSTLGGSLVTDEAGHAQQEGDRMISVGPKINRNDDDGGVNDLEAGADGVLAPGVGEVSEDSLTATNDAPLQTISGPVTHTASGEGSALESDNVADSDSSYSNLTTDEIDNSNLEEKNVAEEAMATSSTSDLEIGSSSDHAYIVEYSLEYGFLRLTSETRQRLNISVKLIALDPQEHSCFGNNFSRFLLDHFLGYDDILMSSIKNLAETEENRGYLRNVVTGEQFRFVSMWMARSAYLPALLIMLVFTVSISMLLRYSHHQIFVFIVDLLNNVEGNGAIHVPAAPLFTVILALVGMEAIMSEFFNDTSTAFYVILIVWIADQYDSVCCHTNVTRTYWVRFFYLYHFVFYAYHYRFNGQYGGLALLTSWSFIQHSMVYFYHHYELPTILRQAHQGDDQARAPPPPRANMDPAAGDGRNQSSGELPRNVGNTGLSDIRNSRSSVTIPSQPSATSLTSRAEPIMSMAGSNSRGQYNITTVSAELTITSSDNGLPDRATSFAEPEEPLLLDGHDSADVRSVRSSSVEDGLARWSSAPVSNAGNSALELPSRQQESSPPPILEPDGGDFSRSSLTEDELD